MILHGLAMALDFAQSKVELPKSQCPKRSLIVLPWGIGTPSRALHLEYVFVPMAFLWFPMAFLWFPMGYGLKKLKSFSWVLIFWKDQISQILYIKYKPDVGFIAVKTHPKFNQNVAPDSTFATACRQACSSTHLTPPKLQSKRSKSFGKCGGKFLKTSSEKQQKKLPGTPSVLFFGATVAGFRGKVDGN